MCESHSEELVIESDGRRIYGTLHVPNDGQMVHPLVIMSHGFGGAHNPEDPCAEFFAREGFMCYAFDFCGGGYASRSDGDVLEMSVLTEARDLSDVMDALMARSDVDAQCVVLMGRSQGGFVSAYVAAQRPRDVRALVLLFPAFVLQDDARGRMDAEGRFPETSTIMGVTVGRVYGEDAVSFDIYDVIGAYDGHVLILHGDEDMIVPLSYSERAVTCYHDAELVVFSGQGHGFRNGDGNAQAAGIAMRFLRDLAAS